MIKDRVVAAILTATLLCFHSQEAKAHPPITDYHRSNGSGTRCIFAFRARRLLDTHQVPAAPVLTSQGCEILDDGTIALIELPPVTDRILNQVDHARREHVCALGQKSEKRLAQASRALAHRDPMSRRRPRI
jgi:hypothetical protein